MKDVSAKRSPESQTLREVFNLDKSTAVEAVRELAELIPEIELDEWFGHKEATYQNRPMRPLRIAQELCESLENLESLKLIIAKEIW